MENSFLTSGNFFLKDNILKSLDGLIGGAGSDIEEIVIDNEGSTVSNIRKFQLPTATIDNAGEENINKNTQVENQNVIKAEESNIVSDDVPDTPSNDNLTIIMIIIMSILLIILISFIIYTLMIKKPNQNVKPTQQEFSSMAESSRSSFTTNFNNATKESLIYS